jgi:D-alanine-D-alanine ligase
VLDQLGIHYTGATTEAVFLTSNKIVAKRLLTGSAIPTPPWHTKQNLQNGCPLVPGTYIIKSVWEHGSVGLDDKSKVSVSSPTDLLGALQRGEGELSGECFAEAFVEGREFNFSLLEMGKAPQVLPPAEILFREFPPGKAKIVGYCAKWEADSFEYTHTPRSFDFSEEDVPLLDELAEIALTCWDLFALRGYARVDFRVDAAIRPWVLEVNTNPCLSPDAGFVAATERAGLAFEEVIEHIIAASRPVGNDHLPTHNHYVRKLSKP